ncbi:MAG: hypothetical protein R3E50_15680 [Halioglobus sp.]
MESSQWRSRRRKRWQGGVKNADDIDSYAIGGTYYVNDITSAGAINTSQDGYEVDGWNVSADWFVTEKVALSFGLCPGKSGRHQVHGRQYEGQRSRSRTTSSASVPRSASRIDRHFVCGVGHLCPTLFLCPPTAG